MYAGGMQLAASATCVHLVYTVPELVHAKVLGKSSLQRRPVLLHQANDSLQLAAAPTQGPGVATAKRRANLCVCDIRRIVSTRTTMIHNNV